MSDVIENPEMIKSIKDAPFMYLFNYFDDTKDGLIIEFGVHIGNTMRLIQHCTDRPVFGFDSFEGLPESWTGAGGVPAGHFACEIPTGFRENVVLIKGWFEDTLKPFCEGVKFNVNGNNKVSVIHIDCDVYSGARTIFNILKDYDMFQDGSIIIFDEMMGYPDWENGEFKAFNQFLQEDPRWNWECIGFHGGNQNKLEDGGEVKCAFRLKLKEVSDD